MKKINDKNYHGLVNELGDYDHRVPEYLKQYEERGFDDTETWNLFMGITKYILPRLIRFKEIPCGYPSNLTEDKWDTILQQMIDAFELIKRDTFIPSKEDQTIINLGLENFKEYFLDLWT